MLPGTSQTAAQNLEKKSETPKGESGRSSEKTATDSITEAAHDVAASTHNNSGEILYSLPIGSDNTRAEKIRESYDKLKQTVLSGREITDFMTGGDIAQFRKDARVYAERHIEGKYAVSALENQEVEIRRRGIKHALARYSGEDKIRAIAALPDLLQNSVLLLEEAHKFGHDLKIYVLISPLKIGRNEYVAKLIVREDSNGKLFYDHDLTKIENLAAFSKSEDSHETESAGGAQREGTILLNKVFAVNKNEVGIVNDKTNYDLSPKDGKTYHAIRKAQAGLMRVFNRLKTVHQRNVFNKRLAAKAVVTRRGNELFLNPAGIELLRQAHQAVFGDAPRNGFFGAYQNRDINLLVFDALKKTVPGEFQQIAKSFLDQVYAAIDAGHGDTRLVATDDDGNYVEAARQEEYGHQGDARLRNLENKDIEPYREIDEYNKAANNLRANAYRGASERAIHNEIIAKAQRDDAAAELGISWSGIDRIMDVYFSQAEEAGLTAEEYAGHFKNIGKQADRNIERYGQRAIQTESQRNNVETDAVGTRSGGEEIRGISRTEKEGKTKLTESLNNFSTESGGLSQPSYALADESGESEINLEKLYNKDGEFNYEQVKDVARRIGSGELEITRLSPREEQGRHAGGRRNVEASVICGAEASANRKEQKDRRPLRKEKIENNARVEAQLEKYARHENIWFGYDEFAKTHLYLKRGEEAEIFEDSDIKFVLKVVNYAFFDPKYSLLEFIDERISLFNYLFPETKYELVGFTRNGNGQFCFILKKLILPANADFQTQRLARKLLRQFDNSIDPTPQDVIQIATGKSAPAGIKQARQEERIHRADYRIGDQYEIGIKVARSLPQGRKSMINLKKGVYKKATIRQLAIESIAKAFVDGGNNETGLTNAENDELAIKYLQTLLKNNKSMAEIEENYAKLSKKAGRYVEYVKRNQGSNTGTESSGATPIPAGGQSR